MDKLKARGTTIRELEAAALIKPYRTRRWPVELSVMWFVIGLTTGLIAGLWACYG